MDHIVADIQPFVLQQIVSVYKNGECVKSLTCSLDSIEDTIVALATLYDTNTVDLGGNKIFTSKIRDDLHTRTKYQKYNLKVTIY